MRRARRGLLALALGAQVAACGSGPGEPLAGAPSDGLVFVRPSPGAAGSAPGSADLARARLADGAVIGVAETSDREELWPRWAPAARQIVFQARVAGTGGKQLLAWDPVTSAETPLTSRFDHAWHASSAAGDRLAYTERWARRSKLVLFEAATGEHRTLLESTRKNSMLRPNFSPDGRRVVVQRRNGRIFSSDLLLVGIDGRSRELTGGAWDQRAAFRHDGASIVFVRRPVGGGPGKLMQLELAAGEARPVPPASDLVVEAAAPSPARDEIAFVAESEDGLDLFLLGPDSAAPRRLTRTPGRDEAAPRWSPDGERIAVSVGPSSSRGQATRAARWPSWIVVTDRDGEVVFETEGDMPDWMPAWR